VIDTLIGRSFCVFFPLLYFFSVFDVDDVNHALDALGKLHEGPNLVRSGLALPITETTANLLSYISPRIAQRLLQAQSDTAIFRGLLPKITIRPCSWRDNVPGVLTLVAHDILRNGIKPSNPSLKLHKNAPK